MGDKGGLGVALDLEKVPTREEGMTAYEMMLSESQERMLMVLRPEKEAEAKAIFDKWDLDFAVVGETIEEDRFLIRLDDKVKADLPLAALSGTAPEYDRPWVASPAAEPAAALPDHDPAEALLKLVTSENYCSRRWVWEQYDNTVMADTVIRPGSDAAVVRVHGTGKAIAFTSDVTPRYCKANPVEGGKQAVAEAFRNLCATGARPLATTDNLNFGNPEKPEIMGQFVGCIQGIGAACRTLDMPIVSGNVSLYNETDGQAILPTPTIGAVGLLKSLDELIRVTPGTGEVLVLLGSTTGHLEQSAYAWELFRKAEGDAPQVDLRAERKTGELVRALHAEGLITAAHDLSDGGLALAAAEMALAANTGVALDPHADLASDAWFFGEDQGRYLLSCDEASVARLTELAIAAGVSVRRVGRTGGDEIKLGTTSVPLTTLRDAHEAGFSRMMGET
jgi:phosphoribosylformylglycinamidine synthase